MKGSESHLVHQEKSVAPEVAGASIAEKIRNASYKELLNLENELLNNRPIQKESAEAIFEKALDLKWLFNDRDINPVVSWEIHHARTRIFQLMEKVLRPSSQEVGKSDIAATYEYLAEKYEELAKKRHNKADEWETYVLKSLLCGTSPQWLISEFLRRVDQLNVSYEQEKNPKRSFDQMNERWRELNWLAAYRSVLFGKESTYLRQFFIDYCGELSFDPSKGSGQPMRLLRESVFGSRAHRSDGTEEKQLLQQLVIQSKGTYFFHLYAQALKEMLEDGSDPEYQGRRDSYIPFQVTRDAFAVSHEYLNKPILIVSRPHEYDQINILLADLKKIEPALEKRRAEIKSLYEQFGSETDDWPARAVDELRNHIPEEQEEYEIINGLRSHFFDKNGTPLGNKLVRIQDVTPSAISSELIFELYTEDIREFIGKKLNASLKDLTVREQISFLQFADRMTVGEGEQLELFSKKFGHKGLRTFFALDLYGRDFGKDIINFANRQVELGDEETAVRIFDHFSNILDQIDKLDVYIAQRFEKHGDNEISKKASRNIEQRAARFLLELIKSKQDSTNLLEELKRTEENAVLFSSVFRALTESGSFNLEQFTGYETYSSEELGTHPELVASMSKIIRENYERHYANKSFNEEVLGFFSNALNSPNTTFHVLKDKERIVGFVRFDERYKDDKLEDVYFGSFNVDGPFGGGAIGEALFKAVLEQYKKLGVPIRADCDPDSSPTQKIYLPAGFIQEGKPYELTGQKSITIVLWPKSQT